MPRYRSTVLYAGNRADYVALGASLETAVIAARHRGFHVVERIQTDKDHIASLQLTPGAASGAEPLYEQITRRRSVRTRPATINAIPDVALDRMRAQVESVPGIQLRWLNDSAAIAELAELTGQAERLRILDPVSHAELIENELCWNESRHQSHGTGIPMSALSLSAAELAGLEFIRDPDVISSLARWNGGNGMKTLGNELIRTSSALGLIWSNSDTLATYLDGGRALQRLWLQATADDIGMCPMATLCYLIATWRRGQLATQMQRDALPDMEKRFRALFDLPESRSDIAVFRLVPADGHLRGERSTRRLPLRDVTS